MKKLTIFFLVLFSLISITGLGVSNGDYRSKNSGLWNDYTCWEKYNNGWKPCLAGDFPALDGLQRRISISTGHTITATGNITSSAFTTGITIDAEGTLDMGSYFISGSNTVDTKYRLITISGTLIANNYISTSNFVITSIGTFITSYPGPSGWWYGNSNPNPIISGTVEFTGGPDQKVPDFVYGNIVVSGTDRKSGNGFIEVDGQVLVNQDATLSLNGSLMASEISLYGTLETSPTSTIDVVNLNIYKDKGLVLHSDNISTASLLISGVLNSDIDATGSIESELFLKGSSWHYITPPVPSQDVSLFSSLGIRNVSLYDESYITTNMDNGWVNYEGYHYNAMAIPPAWQLEPAKQWSTLYAGYAYNYYNTSDATFNFTINSNTPTTTVDLKFATGGTGTPALQGFNLIGNPFPCGIDWDIVITDPNNTSASGWYSVEQAIYFRNNGNLIIYNNGVTNPNNYNVSAGFIPPMQGFFIKSNVNNFTLSLPSNARIHTSSKRYKGISIIPLIRLEASNSSASDQTVIRFDEKATTSYDNNFDARKLFPDSNLPSISSLLNGMEYSINGIPYPQDDFSIPIKFYAPVTGSYTISAKEIIGLENYNFSLKDISQNVSIDLSDQGTYTFNAIAGNSPNRFVLTVSNIVTSVREDNFSDLAFKIFGGNNLINIKALSNAWAGTKGNLRVIDLTGRQMLSLNNLLFNYGELKQIPFNYKGAYIIEITSPGKRFVGKIMIK